MLRILPLLLLPAFTFAEPPVASTPTASLETFQKEALAHGDDPEATAILFVQALATAPRDRLLAERMLAVLLRDSDLSPPTEHNPSPLTTGASELVEQVRKRPDIARGYCGGTPAQGYRDANLENCPARLDHSYSQRAQGRDYPEPGRAKYFVVNGGSDRPRPVELQLEGGRWRIRGWSALATGVRAPE